MLLTCDVFTSNPEDQAAGGAVPQSGVGFRGGRTAEPETIAIPQLRTSEGILTAGHCGAGCRVNDAGHRFCTNVKLKPVRRRPL